MCVRDRASGADLGSRRTATARQSRHRVHVHGLPHTPDGRRDGQLARSDGHEGAVRPSGLSHSGRPSSNCCSRSHGGISAGTARISTCSCSTCRPALATSNSASASSSSWTARSSSRRASPSFDRADDAQTTASRFDRHAERSRPLPQSGHTGASRSAHARLTSADTRRRAQPVALRLLVLLDAARAVWLLAGFRRGGIGARLRGPGPHTSGSRDVEAGRRRTPDRPVRRHVLGWRRIGLEVHCRSCRCKDRAVRDAVGCRLCDLSLRALRARQSSLSAAHHVYVRKYLCCGALSTCPRERFDRFIRRAEPRCGRA